MLTARARLLRLVRAYFDEQAFVEVDTPWAVPSPGLDLHLDAFEVVGERRGRRWLITSPEYQMKRILSAGFPRIYQLSHCARMDEEGQAHQPEFMMLEWYRAPGGMHDVMHDTEHMVFAVAGEMGLASEIVFQGKSIDLTPPWDRMTVREAFHAFAGVVMDEVVHDEDAFFRILVEQIEPNLGLRKPVFLTHYPRSMASLARQDPLDPSVAERFEAYVAGMELCNGFGELTDAAEQRERLLSDQRRRAREGKVVYPIDERFLDALRVGVPAAGGNALGFDRLAMLLLDAHTIDDVVWFAASRL
jgi:lysyl-tRNA synthetase class 2